MDVERGNIEQALKWASLRTSSQGCDDNDYAAFTTLAAEVRRLQALAYPQQGSEADKIPWKEHHEAAIALALENDKRIGELQDEVRRLRGAVPSGHVRDETGADRRVLGELRTTIDGCVIGENAQVWVVMADHRDGRCLGLGRTQLIVADDWEETDIGECYSTREAADAARRTP